MLPHDLTCDLRPRATVLEPDRSAVRYLF